MSSGNKEEAKATNENESTRRSRKARRRRKKSDIHRCTDESSTTDIVVNGVFLKSIRPEDTKALKPAEWEAVRDFVLNERKKLNEKNAVDVAGESDNDNKCRENNNATKSPPENASNVATNKNNRSKKKKGVKVKSGSPTNLTINGVFLKSIWPDDTKALTPADWKLVRDYVTHERKRVAEENGPNDDRNVDQLDSAYTKTDVSAKTAPLTSDSEVQSPQEIKSTTTTTDAKKAAANKNNNRSKKKNGRNGGKDAKNLMEPVKDSDIPVVDDQQRSSLNNNRRANKAKNASANDSNTSSQKGASTKQLAATSVDIEQLGGKSKKSSAKWDNAVIEVDHLSAQLLAETEKRLAADEQAKIERDRADRLAKQITLLRKELKRVTNDLEKSKSEAKRHLITQQLLAIAKKENASLCLEQSKVAKLNSQLVLEMAAKESCVKELERIKELVASERKNVGDLREELSAKQRLAVDEQVKIERDRVTFLRNELKRVTDDLEKSKSEAKRYMITQERLVVAKKDLSTTKKDLSTANASLCLEQSIVAKINSQLVLEMAAKESCVKELERTKEVVASERKNVDELREELSATKTARDSFEQELNDNKLRAERVQKLEIELREERAKIAKLGNPSVKATVILRKELHDTQEKLKKAKKRNEVLTAELSEKNYPQRQQQRDKKGPDGETTGKISLKVASPKRATLMPAPVEVSLSDRASLVNFESAPLHYDGIDQDGDDGDESPVQDEIAFIHSAYPSEEISVDKKQITYTRELPVDNDSEDVRIDISVTLPNRYPSVVIDEIKVAMNEMSTCSSNIRKIALDALPALQEICLIEARASEGSTALLSIFSVADMWAKEDWSAVMAKQLSLVKGKGKHTSSKNSGGKGSMEICTFLIYTHHITDPEKIKLVKKTASKLNLGGYIKIGKPGLILVEGTQTDCESLLETLLLNRKKLRERGGRTFDTSTFSPAGKMQRYDNERKLPKKLEQLEAQDGMNKIKDACKKLGLLESLDEVCKR